MSREQPNSVRDEGVLSYYAIGFAGLAVYLLASLEKGNIMASLVALLVGVAGLTAGWRISPGLFLLLTALGMLDPNNSVLLHAITGESNQPRRLREFQPTMNIGASFALADMLQGLAVLAYLVAQYRLFGLLHQSMPSSRIVRRERRRDYLEPTKTRPARLVTRAESAAVLGTSLGVILLAQLASILLFRAVIALNASTSFIAQQRFYLLAWVLTVLLVGIVWLLTAVVLNRLSWGVMDASAARIYLLNQVWLDSQREQRRQQVWRKWYRAKRPRQEETSS